ncbi:alkaline phosphatase family protein [Riemerella anatipestifer]|uniref:alkaline phosphatase D family protein n=1 Tax=Riemerella anatipestifer TaxID=34085 RepID=UPI00069C4D99|nr:alkaline phosphatase D family protein [Riemerella anatipestifer]
MTLLKKLLSISIFSGLLITNAQEKFTIGIASCSKQDKDLSLLDKVVEKKPNLFIWMGDNIYGDTYDMTVLEAKYQKLTNNPHFKNLKKNVPMLSTWDDHDYGWNDAGKEYPHKEASKALFLKYWEVNNKFRQNNPNGIYGVEYFTFKNKKIQIIILDTRFNRDALCKFESTMPFGKNDYVPCRDTSKSFLGEAQWNWLEEILKTPADLRILVSSIQFSHEYNGWESWTNLPSQQQKMMDLIKKTKAENLFVISGDVHWGELSKYSLPNQYPIYDLTSSGLTEKWPSLEPNKFRIGEAVVEPNYGIIEYDGENQITFKLYDHKDILKLNYQLDLETLKFK